MYVCMYVCMSICLSIYLSVFLFVYMYVCLSIYLSSCLSVCLCICLSVCLFVCLRSVSLYVCLPFLSQLVDRSVCQCTYLSFDCASKHSVNYFDRISENFFSVCHSVCPFFVSLVWLSVSLNISQPNCLYVMSMPDVDLSICLLV